MLDLTHLSSYPSQQVCKDLFAIYTLVNCQNLPIVHRNAYWSKDTEGGNSIIMFPCEYKGDKGMHNKNQLLMDLGAAQHQH